MRLAGSGKVDAKHAAFPGLALHRHLTAVFVHDLGNDGQAKPDAFGLGGEKRIEDGLQVFGLDAGAAIDHRSSTASSASRVFTVTVPPAGVACAALSSRL